MLEVPPVEATTIIGAFIVVLALAFLRFGDWVIDLLASYGDSPVEMVEDSISE